MRTLSLRDPHETPFTVSLGDHGSVLGLAAFGIKMHNPHGFAHADLDVPMTPHNIGQATFTLVERKLDSVQDASPGAGLVPFIDGGDITITDTEDGKTIKLINCKRKSGGEEQPGLLPLHVSITVMFSDITPDGAVSQTASDNHAAGWEMGHV